MQMEYGLVCRQPVLYAGALARDCDPSNKKSATVLKKHYRAIAAALCYILKQEMGIPYFYE